MDAGGAVGTEVVARGEWVSDTGNAVWKAVEHIAAWVGPDPCDDCSERGEAVEHIAAWAGPDPCDDCSERGAEGTWMRSAAVGVMAKGGSSRRAQGKTTLERLSMWIKEPVYKYAALNLERSSFGIVLIDWDSIKTNGMLSSHRASVQWTINFFDKPSTSRTAL